MDERQSEIGITPPASDFTKIVFQAPKISPASRLLSGKGIEMFKSLKPETETKENTPIGSIENLNLVGVGSSLWTIQMHCPDIRARLRRFSRIDSSLGGWR